MKIKINNDWGITSDRYQYSLCKIGKEDGEEKFRPISHTYQTIGEVLEDYIKIRVRIEDGITEFKEIIELEKELLEEIQDIKKELNIEERIKQEEG